MGIDKIVIVVGCQRSGTTLVAQVLGAHRRALLIDEDDGLYDWALALVGKHALVQRRRDWPDVCRRARRKYTHPETRFDGSGDLLGHVDHLVLKAPNLTYCAEGIAREFPRARVVYVYRDPRAIVASMRRLPEIPFVDNQVRHLRGDPELSKRHRAALQTLTDPTVPMHVRMAIVAGIKMSLAADFESAGLVTTRVRYEDLVTRPGAIGELLARVGLPVADPPSDPGHESVFRGAAPGGTDRTRAVDSCSVDRWRRELTPAEQQDILRHAEGLPGFPAWMRGPTQRLR